jgi:hypothetical protein
MLLGHVEIKTILFNIHISQEKYKHIYFSYFRVSKQFILIWLNYNNANRFTLQSCLSGN